MGTYHSVYKSKCDLRIIKGKVVDNTLEDVE